MLRLDYVAGVSPAKWLRVWAELRPDLPIDARRVDEARQRAALDAGEADLAVVRLPVGLEGLHRVALWEEAPVVALPKEHPLADAERFTLAELDGLDRAPHQDDAAMLLELVGAGTGIALLPQPLARLHRRRDVVIRPVTDAEPTEIALLWRRERDDADIQEFVGVVRGRTARSSRRPEEAETPPPEPPARKGTEPARTGRGGRAKSGGTRGGASARRTGRPGRGRRR